MNKKLKVTVGIPTCYGGQSLVETVKTLRASEYDERFEILIEADRTPLTAGVKKVLLGMGVKLHWNKIEGSQFKKLKQTIKKATGDVFIFTQDDIVFDKEAIQEIVKAFEKDPQLTMYGAKVLPLPPQTFFESTMVTMMKLARTIATSWNKGDNYLLASARCLAFRKSHLNKFRLFDNLTNTDVFMYFENKRLNGKFRPSEKAKVFIRNPQNIKDQIGPSSRYQYSQIEVSRYFKEDLAPHFKIPLKLILRGMILEFLKDPIGFFSYVLVFAYTRIKKQTMQKALRTSWELDLSTKSSFQA